MKNIIAIIISVLLISASWLYRVDALSITDVVAVDFGGTIGEESDVCCNGYTFEVSSNQTNNAGDGTHLMSWWAIVSALKDAYATTPQAATLGKVIQGGTCITVSSECESTETVDYSYYGISTTESFDQIGIAASPSY
jgi:hypothetical protein